MKLYQLLNRLTFWLTVAVIVVIGFQMVSWSLIPPGTPIEPETRPLGVPWGLFGISEAIAIDEAIEVVFSHPVFADPANLALVSLVDATGAGVAVEYELSEDGRHLRLVPTAPLSHATGYTVVVDPSFESFDQGPMWTADPSAPTAWEIPLRTASAPALVLEGEYRWTIDMPTADIEAQQFDLDNTLPVSVDGCGSSPFFALAASQELAQKYPLTTDMAMQAPLQRA